MPHVQIWSDADEQEEVLAMVARTGEHTWKGKMLQSLQTNASPPDTGEHFTPAGLNSKASLTQTLNTWLMHMWPFGTPQSACLKSAMT